MEQRVRADLLLVERGLYESRARAQSAIAAGLVKANGALVTKPSSTLPADAAIDAAPEHPYVSRGALKLEAALDHFKIDAKDRVCLDIGASTGGFTDLLLKRGAKHVYAIDVGRDQLHHSLRDDPRITSRESCDARNLTREDFSEVPSLIVIDVSFISLSLILPHVLPLAGHRAMLVALIKPQFEVGRAALKKGIVKDDQARDDSVKRIEALVTILGWHVRGLIDSPIAGGDGNQEFLMIAERPHA
jgi:23S rRNA (cytidine1920-2'-O)/16S rRNA (cytidine1409-2'-O)-methyltransferase